MKPVYIVMLHNLVTGMSFVNFASANKDDAIEFFKNQDHKKPYIIWVIKEWKGKERKVLDIKKNEL